MTPGILRRLLRASLLVTLGATLLACPLKKKKGAAADPDDDDPPVANAPTIKVSGTGAKNEGDVLRYEKETKLLDEPGEIGKDGTKVKAFPISGQEVATLAKGTPIVKIAKYFSTGVLITFNDPNTLDGTRLMGWVPPDGVAVVVAAATATPARVTPVVPTVKPQVPVTPVDAGAKTVDAGAAPVAPTAVDAGAPAKPSAVLPNAGTLQVFPDGGKCPAGFALMGAFCRRPCNADKDCPPRTFCTGAGRKSCSATK